LGEVEEMDQYRPRARETVDGLHRLPDPLEVGRKRRYGDIGAGGSQAPEGMLRASVDDATVMRGRAARRDPFSLGATRLMMEGELGVSGSVWERIEESRARYNVLEHPFYQRWSAGELTDAELARYAGQYRHATEAIARLCADAAESAPPESREELQRHAEEESGHVKLWDDFVEATGGEIGAQPTPETNDCVRAWTALGGYLETLARLYAIESGQPEISRVKREGLSSFYGIDGGPGSEYFRVHEQADLAHAEQSRRLISRAMDAADEDAIVEAAESAFLANWRLLDGVN
jgi:pyrroloquinoline-quinone synthase